MDHIRRISRVLGLCLCVGVGSLAVASDAGRVEWTEVPAPSLEGNRLGTPTVQRTAVYLPPSYDASEDRRYPVVYLLHGIFDTPEAWLRFFDVPGALDRSIASGAVPELIAVMPTGRNDLGGGFYRNSSVAGNWGDFVRSDLVGFVDTRYRTVASREARAIAGHSMGGFGAIWHSMSSADVFSVAYAMSPALLGIEDDLSHGNVAAWRGMIDMKGREGIQDALARRDFWAIAAWAVCTTFMPNPDDGVLMCDPPYRVENGELLPVESSIDRWRALAPVTAADEYLAALRSMKAIALDYGLDDQFAHIPETTQQLSDVFAEIRVAHDLFVYRGDHRARVKERLEAVVLPWIAGHLAN